MDDLSAADQLCTDEVQGILEVQKTLFFFLYISYLQKTLFFDKLKKPFSKNKVQKTLFFFFIYIISSKNPFL